MILNIWTNYISYNYNYVLGINIYPVGYELLVFVLPYIYIVLLFVKTTNAIENAVLKYALRGVGRFQTITSNAFLVAIYLTVSGEWNDKMKFGKTTKYILHRTSDSLNGLKRFVRFALTVDASISCGQQYNKKLLHTFGSLNCTWYLLVSPVNEMAKHVKYREQRILLTGRRGRAFTVPSGAHELVQHGSHLVVSGHGWPGMPWASQKRFLFREENE